MSIFEIKVENKWIETTPVIFRNWPGLRKLDNKVIPPKSYNVYFNHNTITLSPSKSK